MKRFKRPVSRRRFLSSTLQAGVGAGVASLAPGLSPSRLVALAKTNRRPKATADSIIFIWLAGGMCHVDTFDPKDAVGDGGTRAGSYYKKIETASPQIQLCEHLPRMAKWMDRASLVRSMTHSFAEHTAAVNFSHTGRPPSGTIIYPSLGSVISHEVGPLEEKAPAYVVLGQPMVPRGPGFLGGKYGYLYVLNTEEGPAGLQPAFGRTLQDHQRREVLLGGLSESFYAKKASEPLVEAYEAVTRQGYGMMNEKFLSMFNVRNEPDSLKQAFGEEFGQRCLLSRKLVQGGVRFVECSFNLHFINGYGWDAHAFAQKRLHLVIEQLDRGLSMLLQDLDQNKLLERTLVVLATEFGRPPEFDGQGGRGHQSKGYSILFAGGGVQGGRVIGRTDELGGAVADRPVTIPDLHATLYQALGIDLETHLEAPGGRPVPVTDFGKPVAELFVS